RCVSISPAELLERMTRRRPPENHRGGSGGDEQEGEAGQGDGNRSPCPMRPGFVDTVALDIRPLHDYESSGAGHLGKSLRLDPYLLEMDDVLEKWMQHFDGTRGTHVCLVDSLDPATAAFAYTGDDSGYGGGGGGAGGGGGVPQSGGLPQQEQRRPRAGDSDGSGGVSKPAAPAATKMIEDPLWR
ncbi:unnamed protein product, partial [Hapterophycus canaliculatus]